MERELSENPSRTQRRSPRAAALAPRWGGPRSASSVRLLVGLANDYGRGPATILQDTGIALSMLEDPDAEITGSQELSVVRNIVDSLGDVPGLGLEAGRRYHLTTFGMVGYAVLSSASGREAFELLLRFRQLMCTFSQVQIVEQGGDFDVVFDDSSIPVKVRRFLFERDIAATHHGLELTYGVRICPRAVEARFPAPDRPSQYEEALGAPARFGASRNALSYRQQQLDQPLPQADRHTAKLTVAQCEALLAKRRRQGGVTGQVRRILVRDSTTAPNMERAARQLGTTSRSLRRRLAEEGTSFRALSDDVRESLAEGLLCDEGLSVKSASYHLGFSDTRSFVAAFKRWKGLTPTEWRDSVLR